MHLNGGCKSELGENDHRSPSNNRAQGYAYGQHACRAILSNSIPQASKKKKKKKTTHILKYGAFTFCYCQLQIQR